MKDLTRTSTIQFCQFYFELFVEFDESNGLVSQSINKAYTKNGDKVRNFSLTESYDLLKQNAELQKAVNNALDGLAEELYEVLLELEDEEDDNADDAALEAWRERVGHRY